jgi:hypothetical protein
MIGRRSFLTLMAIGMLAGAPVLAAQAPGHSHHPRVYAEWRHGGDGWTGRRLRLERRGIRYRHQREWLEPRQAHRFRRWDQRRHLARRHWHRHWDGMI